MRRIRLTRALIAAGACAASTVVVMGAIGTSTALAAPVAAASASCEATISVANVGIDSAQTYDIKGTMNPCAANAYWDMDGGSGYAQEIGAWTFKNSDTAYSYYFPNSDDEPLGNYKAAGTGAFDSQFNPVPQNTAYFAIKLDSATRIEGYRSGDDVYVRAHVGRYNPHLKSQDKGGWQPSEGRTVTFYNWHSTWNESGTARTGSNGYTPYVKIYAPTGRSFHAYAGYTSTMWGNQSGNTYH